MRDLLELYDAIDLMVWSGDGLAPQEQLDSVRRAIDGARRRSATLGTTLLVAIAGGTGTGKSSLLNAVASDRVASVSRLRPHTDEPLAWIPEGADPALEHLLMDQGVTQIHRQTLFRDLALVDLPDVDSMEAHHRSRVWDLFAVVDAVVWVLDPEKYRDTGLRTDFLDPMSAYADQTVFVLNKIDQIPDTELGDVLNSVATNLARSGYPEPVVFPAAADPETGGPVGVAPLVERITAEVDRKRVAYGKLLTDVASAIRNLGVDTGVWNGASVEWDKRWLTTRDTAISTLRQDVPFPGEDALCRIEDLLAAAASEIGGELGDEIRGRFDEEEVMRVMTTAQQSVAAADLVAARRVLDESVGAVIATMLLARSRFAALVALTHIGVRQVAHRYGVTVL